MNLLISGCLLIVGFAMLIKGSDFFIESSASIARRFSVSELIIGLTLASVGTSLPELGASVAASIQGSGGIAVGNVVGSNIINIALVLGLCTVIRGYKTDKTILKRDGYIMGAVSLLLVFLVFQGTEVSRLDGLILITIFFLYLRLLFKKGIREERRSGGEGEEGEEAVGKAEGLGREVLILVGGLAGVLLGAKLLIDAAVEIAKITGVSESVIGVTVIAFGTSLPELAVSVGALMKGKESLSIGNIIGSNIFNILWVIGVASLVNSLAVDRMLFYFNIPLMLIVAILLLLFMRIGWKLERWEGAVFIALYIFFIAFNYGYKI